jgi:hypothetical protein
VGCHMVVFNVCSPHSYIQVSGVLIVLNAQVGRNVEPVSTLLSPMRVLVKVRKPVDGEGIPSESIRKNLHPDPRLKKSEKEWGWA